MSTRLGYFEGLKERMQSERIQISEQIAHQGEKGRNNERILLDSIKEFLPKKYSIGTGKVISPSDNESQQVDIIIYDHFNCPNIIAGRSFVLVPREAVYGVVSVKTTHTPKSLKEGLQEIRSVRALYDDDGLMRPRSFLFAYTSSNRLATIRKHFTEGVSGIPDQLRPNCLCILDKCLLLRKPYTDRISTEYNENVLLHFFLFLATALDSFTLPRLPLRSYFNEYPDL